MNNRIENILLEVKKCSLETRDELFSRLVEERLSYALKNYNNDLRNKFMEYESKLEKKSNESVRSFVRSIKIWNLKRKSQK